MTTVTSLPRPMRRLISLKMLLPARRVRVSVGAFGPPSVPLFERRASRQARQNSLAFLDRRFENPQRAVG